MTLDQLRECLAVVETAQESCRKLTTCGANTVLAYSTKHLLSSTIDNMDELARRIRTELAKAEKRTMKQRRASR